MEVKKRNKKTAGIITLYHGNYNFGGLLQAYALPAAIRQRFQMDAEQIDYVEFRNAENHIAKAGSEKRTVPGRLYHLIYKTGIVFFAKINKKNLARRERAFETFIEEIPHSSEVYDSNTISNCSIQYDVLICGGDQIWNDTRCKKNTEVYTLQFASSDVRKISYAPSMAVLNTTQQFTDTLRQGLNQLDAISIREKRSLPLVQPLTSKKVEVVVDPVLLLDKNDWQNVIHCPLMKRKYILCYLLGDSMAQRKAARAFASHVKCKIATFPHILCNVVRKCDLFFGDIHDYTSGPREFLGLIQNAECVITDSFHACVFSMIFQTPFVVLERDKADTKGNMNSRIYDFLEEYHLENQLVTEQELAVMSEIPKVDFTYAQEHWKIRREESFEYLENALRD